MKKVILSISKLNNTNVVVTVKSFLIKLSNVTFFKTPEVDKQTQVVQDCVDRLEAATTEDSTHRIAHMKAARLALNMEVPILIGLLEQQLYRSGKPESEWATLVEEAGLSIRATRGPLQRTLRVKQGKTVDSVKVSAGKALFHDWEYTSDIEKFTNRIAVGTTIVASVEVSNLIRGTYAFFHRGHQRDMPATWEGPVYFVVAENADQIA